MSMLELSAPFLPRGRSHLIDRLLKIRENRKSQTMVATSVGGVLGGAVTGGATITAGAGIFAAAPALLVGGVVGGTAYDCAKRLGKARERRLIRKRIPNPVILGTEKLKYYTATPACLESRSEEIDNICTNVEMGLAEKEETLIQIACNSSLTNDEKKEAGPYMFVRIGEVHFQEKSYRQAKINFSLAIQYEEYTKNSFVRLRLGQIPTYITGVRYQYSEGPRCLAIDNDEQKLGRLQFHDGSDPFIGEDEIYLKKAKWFVKDYMTDPLRGELQMRAIKKHEAEHQRATELVLSRIRNERR